MRLCVSIAEKNLEDAMAVARNILTKSPDLIEIRFDIMDSLPQKLDVFKEIPVPKIATLRSVDQGGKFTGTDDEKLKFMVRAAESGFEVIDIESNPNLMKMIGGAIRNTKIICSTHDFTGTPDASTVIELLVKNAARSDIAKVAFQVNSIHDLLSIIDGAEGFKETGNEFIIIGMGELGTITRILAHKLGCTFTYVAAEPGKETAPGQLDIETMRFLGDDPIITGITGYPLSHSISPILHNAAFRALKIPGRYLTFPAKKDELEDLVSIVIDLGIRGLNVTIPHKEDIIPYIDKIDSSASQTGAVNTVLNRDGTLIGYNTDLYGVDMTFRKNGVDPSGKETLIIGAGGAARACCAYLLGKGAKVYIVNRTRERAEALIEDFENKIQLLETAELRQRKFDVIINCTPLGMKGFPDTTPVNTEVFSPGQFVFDTIYNPPKTKFLEDAERRGATISSGLEMLIAQAEKAFEIWTGVTPPHEIMLAAAQEALT
ncbi:MAG: shikimate dehydrogenase [Methanomassiliicoccales archaeon]|nr:shikimate dehydrogenase [Methanomassiliicoccales archaeon]